MIFKALDFLQKQLDEYMTQTMGSSATGTWIELSRLVDKDGGFEFDSPLGFALANVEEERIFKSQERVRTSAEEVVYYSAPDIKLNLHVMIVSSAGKGKYDTALKALSSVATFFQARRSFDRERYPSLESPIEKLVVELESLDYESQSYIWSSLGGKLTPFLVYRVRLLRVQEELVAARAEPIREVILDEEIH